MIAFICALGLLSLASMGIGTGPQQKLRHLPTPEASNPLSPPEMSRRSSTEQSSLHALKSMPDRRRTSEQSNTNASLRDDGLDDTETVLDSIKFGTFSGYVARRLLGRVPRTSRSRLRGVENDLYPRNRATVSYPQQWSYMDRPGCSHDASFD